MSETVEPPPVGLGRRIRDAHLGSLFAGLVTVFIVLKVLAVSHFEITTALGIVAESGTASLLVGTLIWSLPSILVALFFGLLVIFDDDATPEPDRRFYRIAGWVVAAVAVLTHPVATGLGFLGLAWSAMGVSPGVGGRKYREMDDAQSAANEVLLARAKSLRERLEAASKAEGASPEHLRVDLRRINEHLAQLRAEIFVLQLRRRWTKDLLRGLVVIYATLTVYQLLTDAPWLPAEHITLDDQAAITGYVLKAESDEVVILDDGSRELVRIERADLQDRRYCVVHWPDRTWFGRPIISLFYETPSYPRCDQLAAPDAH